MGLGFLTCRASSTWAWRAWAERPAAPGLGVFMGVTVCFVSHLLPPNSAVSGDGTGSSVSNCSGDTFPDLLAGRAPPWPEAVLCRPAWWRCPPMPPPTPRGAVCGPPPTRPRLQEAVTNSQEARTLGLDSQGLFPRPLLRSGQDLGEGWSRSKLSAPLPLPEGSGCAAGSDPPARGARDKEQVRHCLDLQSVAHGQEPGSGRATLAPGTKPGQSQEAGVL